MPKILRNSRAVAGMILLGVFLVLAIFGDQLQTLYGWHARDVDYDNLHTPPLVGGHWLGTTVSGQDVLAQTIAGARGSLSVGILSGLVATALAILIGVSSGFIGGIVDQGLNGFTNVILTIPSFPLALIVAGYLGSSSGGGGPAVGFVTIALLIGLLEWPGGARGLRSQTLSLRNRDFAVASRMLGEGYGRLIFVEIVPHLSGIVSAMFLKAVVAGIFAEAGFNFLGVTTQGVISWGTMMYNAQTQGALLNSWWWWFVTPGLCIALVGLATALINFGIDEVSNPQLSAVRRRLVARKAPARAAATVDGEAA